MINTVRKVFCATGFCFCGDLSWACAISEGWLGSVRHRTVFPEERGIFAMSKGRGKDRYASMRVERWKPWRPLLEDSAHPGFAVTVRPAANYRAEPVHDGCHGVPGRALKSSSPGMGELREAHGFTRCGNRIRKPS